ncbi:MAG: hypothetical protein MJ188_07780 [Treponema sp.]|nr:hypothetical protein [Treponema sp.]
MKTILSLPQNLLDSYKCICRPEQKEYFICSDPIETHLGSGGGTAWALQQFEKENENNDLQEKKLLIHAGGQGRRLPAYSASGKIFTPIPVYRWKSGQKIDQTLLDIQSDFYSEIAERANKNQNLIIASGDVLLRCNSFPTKLPETDVVILTTWIDSSVATRHGVIFSKHNSPDVADFMLQKPSAEQIESLLNTHVFMMDTGCWILSDKAVEVLLNKCKPIGKKEYDFYSDFGKALGENPTAYDDDISKLSCAVVNLDGGEFYHYGTSRELITSTEKIQNLVTNPRNILQKKVKAQGSVFVQNSKIDIDWTIDQKMIWIENSCVGKGWSLSGENIITGVPENEWIIKFPKGQCVDIEPVGESSYVIRDYLIDDTFKGDLQFEKRFPIVSEYTLKNKGSKILELLFAKNNNQSDIHEIESVAEIENWFSGDDILSNINIVKLYEQRKNFFKENIPLLQKNYSKSVFYQCDLHHTRNLITQFGMNNESFLGSISEKENSILLMRDAMFRGDEKKAFEILGESIISSVTKVVPQFSLMTDQIAWGRSPARIDIAGGWSDTPPFSIYNGGSVVNLAIDLNGQQPIQSYVRKIKEPYFILRSIDTGVSEKVTSWAELEAYTQVGSSFSIPKAALALAGFSQRFCGQRFVSLEDQLKALGGGLEITTLAAIPKGSGLGTSSIIASTLLGTLSNACSLGWSEQEICFRTLVLEQLLTTGGGWQDQFGGVYGGIKLCTSQTGIQNNVLVRRLPGNVLSDSDKSGLWLLYYTGITRVAKNILADIVRNMFLNKGDTLSCVETIKRHADVMADAIQFCDYKKTAELIKTSWHLNKKLDSGVSTKEIESIIKRIDDYSLGYKLAGAGGGGYMLICAKDYEAAARLKSELLMNPINDRARFVDLSLNEKGLEITRS